MNSSDAAVLAGRPHGALAERLGRFVFAYRDALVPLLLVAILATTRPRAPLGSERLNAWVDALGVLVALAGQVWRVAVIGFAYIQRGGAQKQLSAPTLVCRGLYAHSRNPMYGGDLLLFVGLCLIYHSWAVYALVLPAVALTLLAIVRAEEGYLRARFGAPYLRYCAEVNRFVPRLRGLRRTVAELPFDWRRVVRKEYGTTFAWLSAACALLAWERVSRSGWRAAWPATWRIAAVWMLVAGAWIVARRLKKTGRLRSPD